MAEILDEAEKYLLKYGPTKKSDLLNFLTIVKDYPERNTKKIINKSMGKRFHRIIHPTQPPSVYLSLKPKNQEVRYTDLEPQRALKVARIDWVLQNMYQFVNPKNPLEVAQAKQTEEVLKLVRDFLIKEGKALGR